MSTANGIALVPCPTHNERVFEQLKEVVENNPMTGRHSYFQLKYFVVGKEPTVQARLWQCLRELKARKDSLECLRLELEDLNDKLELANIDLFRAENHLAEETDDLTKQELTIKVRQRKRGIVALGKSLSENKKRQQETEEEAAFFLQAFADLEKVEKCKSFDDFDAQKEYWSARFSNDLNMKLLLQRTIDPELAKAVLSMPDDAIAKREVVGLLNHQQVVIEASRKTLAQKKVQEENG